MSHSNEYATPHHNIWGDTLESSPDVRTMSSQVRSSWCKVKKNFHIATLSPGWREHTDSFASQSAQSKRHGRRLHKAHVWSTIFEAHQTEQCGANRTSCRPGRNGRQRHDRRHERHHGTSIIEPQSPRTARGGGRRSATTGRCRPTKPTSTATESRRARRALQSLLHIIASSRSTLCRHTAPWLGKLSGNVPAGGPVR